MLSRSAQGLYWMGRYMERTQHMCRLLRLQTEALVDRPIREIYFGWSRIYESVNREPPLGSMEIGPDDDYTLADSYTLADDLTFEPSNVDSVWSCLSLARENARQMRHCVSAEMWSRLNLAYLRLGGLAIQDVWRESPEGFYRDTESEIDTFAGVAESTMYRDEGWRFIQVGRLVERAQRLVSLLLAHLDGVEAAGEDSDEGWTSLLRAHHASDAYNRRYSVEVQPDQVLDLLVTDPLLPGSLSRSLNTLAVELSAIGAGPDQTSSDAAWRLVGRMGATVNYEWPEREDRADLLRRIGDSCRDLHHLVTAAYFTYPTDSAPIR